MQVYRLYILGAISLGSFFVRFNQMLFTDNVFWGGDSYMRMQISYSLQHQFDWFPSWDWLPLHFYFLFAQFSLVDDTVFFPRLCHVIVSVAIIYPLYEVAQYWSKNERVALISTILYGISAWYILISGLLLSDVLNSFLCLLALHFLMKYFDQQKLDLSSLTYAGLLFGLANFNKYESWLISFTCGVYLLFKRPHLRHVLVYGLLTAVPILVVFWKQHQLTGDFMRGMNYSDFEVRNIYKIAPMTAQTKFWFMQFGFPFFSLFLAFPYCLYSIFRRNRFLPVVVSCVLLFSLQKLFISETLLPEPRYFLFPSILLMVFMASLIEKLIQFNKGSLLVKLSLLLIVFCYSGYLDRQYIYARDSQGPTFKRGYLETARWYKDADLPEKEKIFVDKDNTWTFNAWPVHAGLTKFMGRGCRFLDRPWAGSQSDLVQIMSCLKTQDIRYILLFDDSRLLKEFSEPDEIFDYLELQLLHRHKNFKIYEIGNIKKMPTTEK